MTKFTIIICVIAAVCVFQTAAAAVMDKLMESSPLSHESAMKMGNHGQELVKDTPMACTNAYNENRRLLEELVKGFDTCVVQHTDTANRSVQELIDAVNDLQATVLKDLLNPESYQECSKHILDMIPCVNQKFSENMSNLMPQKDNVMELTHNLMTYFPNVKVCYDMTMQQLYGVIMPKVMQNGKKCMKSYWPFH